MIGIIGIIFGILGILGGAWGIAGQFLMDAFMAMVPEGQGQAIRETQQAWLGWSILTQVFAIGAAVLLLTAGVGVMRLQRKGVRLIRIWSIVKFVVVGVSAPVNYLIGRDMMAAQMEADPQVANVMGNFAQIFASAGVCFGVVWGFALPVFVLIWFSRKKIKAETAEWS